MTTAHLAPVSAFETARAMARATAGKMIELVAATLHAQFPTSAYLALTRPAHEDDYDELSLDSVRDAQGETVWEFAEDGPHSAERLPAVPAEIATLWGSYDPQEPREVLDLVQRVEDTAPYDFLKFLPVGADNPVTYAELRLESHDVITSKALVSPSAQAWKS